MTRTEEVVSNATLQWWVFKYTFYHQGYCFLSEAQGLGDLTLNPLRFLPGVPEKKTGH